MGSAAVILVRRDDVLEQTAQTPGALRVLGVGKPTGAHKIWMGRVRNEPGQWSVPHHHGEAETAGFLLSGHARIYFGEGYEQWVDMEPGDFCYVPPYLPHVEGNPSFTEPLEFLTARSPDNIVINLPALDYVVHDRWLRSHRSG